MPELPPRVVRKKTEPALDAAFSSFKLIKPTSSQTHLRTKWNGRQTTSKQPLFSTLCFTSHADSIRCVPAYRCFAFPLCPDGDTGICPGSHSGNRSGPGSQLSRGENALYLRGSKRVRSQ